MTAVSVYLCIVAFECRFSNWPCASKLELNAAVLQEQMMSLNYFNFKNRNIFNAVLYVISYFFFSLCVVRFCCLCILMFLCCLCNWPYSCCASTSIIKNRTKLLLLLLLTSSASINIINLETSLPTLSKSPQLILTYLLTYLLT